MRYLLDTNMCIHYLNGTSDSVLKKLELLSFEQVYLCSVVKAELFYGADESKKRTKNHARLGHFFQGFKSLSFTDEAALWYGKIRSNLERQGTPIGSNDLLIAAIALANNVVLVTNNVREFARIEELEIENWIISG